MKVLPLLRDYHERHPGGEALHIFLEDGNIGDGHLLGCYDMAMHGPEFRSWVEHMEADLPGGTSRAARAELDAGEHDHEGAALALVLLAMSRTQRRKLYRLA